jgi:tRNA threonylcarbamoyladenosine biosynthesis protein TsaB
VLILGLDTSTSTAGIAVMADGPELLAAGRYDTSARGADLLVHIDALCRGAGIAPTGLDAVAIGAGPGSFTGLRIGMATAKGIAFALNRPLWAVSSLAALAHDIADAERSAAGTVICAALDARRGEIYAGWFRDDVALAPERVIAPQDLEPWLHDIVRDLGPPGPAVRFGGDALDAHGPALAWIGGAARWSPVKTPSGAAVARLALTGSRVDITRGGAPVYIRPSEAEVKYPDGVPGALRRR